MKLSFFKERVYLHTYTFVILQCVWIFITLYLHTYAAWTKQGSATNTGFISALVIKLGIEKNVLTS